jgi:hypothetical protein
MLAQNLAHALGFAGMFAVVALIVLTIENITRSRG